jgi:hypothetical protein
MMNVARLRRLLLACAALLLLSAPAAWAAAGPALAGGLAVGFALGAAPFLSWVWIVSRGLSSRPSRILTATLVLAKLGLYSAVLYFLVGWEVVSPLGVGIGITAVVAVMCAGALQDDPAGKAA